MVKYKKTNITAKDGVNYVRTVVENAGSLFHKIEQDNDLGVDALIELIKDENPLHCQIAVQIKSGNSYYNSNNCECIIPVEKHRSYWLNHPLFVIGIVYVPKLKCGYWVDIKDYLKCNSKKSEIRFQTTQINQFNKIGFSQLFIPRILGKTPNLSLPEALKLFQSERYDESFIGLITMFRRFPNASETWYEIINALKEKPFKKIPPVMIYFLAHIPWHGDIFYTGEDINDETKNYARTLLANLKKDDIIKLIHFIDEGIGIARGTIGESVEAIISSLPNSQILLKEIVEDEGLSLTIRQFAAFILAMNTGVLSIPIISQLVEAGSPYIKDIIRHIEHYGEINPYS